MRSQVNRLSTAKRVQVISALVEGASINAIVRVTGVAKHTILKLLEDMGCACAAYHHPGVQPRAGCVSLQGHENHKQIPY